MSIFWYLGFFLLALAVLIVVHEMGHFLVARACGVKVLRFAVGFGQPLFKRRFGRDQTEWAVCAFPLGGYVKMLDEREGDVSPEDAPRAFNRQTVGKRIAIVAAGPIANFLLAIVVYWGVFLGGVDELTPVIDTPPAASAAAAAGLAQGDRITRVGAKEVTTWSAMRLEILEAALNGPRTELQLIDPAGAPRVVQLDLSVVDRDHLERDFLAALGVLTERIKLPAVIGALSPGGAAETAGIQVGDTIEALDQQPITHWGQVVDTVRLAAGRPLTLQLKRAGAPVAITLTVPEINEAGKKIGRLGMGPKIDPASRPKNSIKVTYGPLEAIAKSLDTTWHTTRLSLSMMWKMVLGEVSWRNLSGPVAIADYAGRSAAMGVEVYIRFIALVSISLGVVNLLPIPILDGGHLMYYFAEIVKGRPVSERVMQIGQKVGLALLLMLMAFALYNDLNRLFSG